MNAAKSWLAGAGIADGPDGTNKEARYEDGDEDRMSIPMAKEWLQQRKAVDTPSNCGLLSALRAALAIEGADAVYLLTDGIEDKKVKASQLHGAKHSLSDVMF